ncbi:WhiB family transcriptional regulator [Actinokineospora enzanensis]|uniref:WhiB family transcriptional regulator n=1 Tax=Actinokineospora enzanensis TaxID=155975 RepID=UPI00036A1673|nr:WhiB family transcriptional regulator [Actinokineospora enzanensis]
MIDIALPRDIDWRQGACTRHPNPALWMSTNPRERAAAAQICWERCPILAACRAHGLAAEPHGVWGGLDAEERRRERQGLPRRTQPPTGPRSANGLSAAQIARIAELVAAGVRTGRIADEIGCNARTVYRHAKQLKASAA